MSVCMGVHIRMIICEGRKSTLGTILKWHSSGFLKQSLSPWDLEFTNWTKLTGQVVPGMCMSLFPQHCN